MTAKPFLIVLVLVCAPSVCTAKNLVELIQKGNAALVRAELRRHPDVNRVKEAATPLLWAIAGGDTSIVSALLAAGADPNLSVPYGLPEDANPRRLPPEPGKSPLAVATFRGNVDLVQLLLAAGANPLARVWLRDSRFFGPNFWGTDARMTPLHLAAASGDTVIIRLLLSMGADPNAPSEQWVGGGWIHEDGTFVGGTRREDSGPTPLQIACEVGERQLPHAVRVDATRLLISAGGDLKSRDHNGTTLLMAAAKAGSADIVKLLLDAGADLNVTDYGHKSALDYARSAKHPEIALLLERRGTR